VVNILICDSDAQSSRMCEESLNIIAQTNSIPVSVRIVENEYQFIMLDDNTWQSTDLIYLEMNLQKQNGIEVAKRLRAKGYYSDIVFYTNDEEDIIQGYDVEALHYVLKAKTSSEKFKEIFLKATARAEKRNQEVISFACAGVHKNIAVQDILYFSVLNRITTVCYRKGKEIETFEFYSSLSKIEEFLYGKNFIRIHGSYLVGKNYIQEIHKKEVVMINGEVLPIGRTYRSNLRG